MIGRVFTSVIKCSGVLIVVEKFLLPYLFCIMFNFSSLYPWNVTTLKKLSKRIRYLLISRCTENPFIFLRRWEIISFKSCFMY